ncbi:ubiquitin conjugation factor E4 [Desarmillaria tabescens]|uniref:RING-type E3 ubiquitin transferase n=1 Tax=Armillaria tabescens TaxID=1929756 RepID=A0AA39TUZ8_ARMTA|nr:ubiquitin conjugation factor E4 [Desarmillaria tabescens]KAK0464249.1 ubiquitin conjugation factor E4 [Desarmillaria tabescens]
MSDNTLTTPQDDAERIRLKRLARLQNTASSAPSTPGSTPTPSTSAAASTSSTPVASPSKPSTPSRPATTKKAIFQTPPPAAPSPVPIKKKAPASFSVDAWTHETVAHILKVTLEKSVAEQSGYEIVWLKQLAEEIEADGINAQKLDENLVDRLLIARLEMDPQQMSDDLEYMPVLVSLPPQQTVFEYLVGCWKRLNASRSALIKKGYTPVDTQNALNKLEKIRDLIISYAGLTLQEPEMFPQPSGRPLGAPELVSPLLSLSALSAPLLSGPVSSSNTLGPSDIEQFLQDLARRFEPDNEIDGVLGPVVQQLLFHASLFRPEGLGGGDASWRGVVSGLEALVSVKAIANMITRMEEWNPPSATAATFETTSLMGPLCRLGVFSREWPGISQSYFSDPEKRSKDDIESSYASLRGTLKSLQSSLFQIFNTLVRASAQSREAVLNYFARVIALNVKRAGMQVDPTTVASDSFMVNLQTILLRFAEPFMDANYTKMDRIDSLYYAHSTRIDLQEETRIKATSNEANEWVEQNKVPNAPPPNFISDIFYLAIAMSHYGYQRTIQSYTGLGKNIEDMQRHLDYLNGDGSRMGGPLQARREAAINAVKNEIAKIRASEFAYQAQLLDPELVIRTLGFTNFLSTWLVRQADPKRSHPNPQIELPLPKDVPMSFRVLPEYIVEDIVEYFLFAVQYSPDKFDLSGKTELLIFVLTFLSSTWYIKNPFLKSKINDVLFIGIWNFGRERDGVLGFLLNTHPLALKHLMSSLMHFYIEVEQTGASSQFYDKFSERNIASILKVVWNNPVHREALNTEAKNVDKFVRFVNLMINDVTYLMDESLSELTQIHNIQVEMDDPAWNTADARASPLSRATVELLKVFTAETKTPFMMPEIVDRLGSDLKVRNPDKYRFNPRALLSDILQVFINLSDRDEFVKAVANDGRSYSKELFESAQATALRRSLKVEAEIQILRSFVERVEAAKATMEAEEELGDVPDEFLDPLMYTVMRDPVILPSSRTIVDRSTIKSHLLSDSKDPFNRVALSIEDVEPDTALKARIDAFLAERRKKTGISSHPEGADDMQVE